MNQEVLNIFNPVQVAPTFDQIRISLASPERIRALSRQAGQGGENARIRICCRR